MYVQIVNFTLANESTEEEFLTLSGAMLAWLRSQPGFKAYELYRGRRTWTDRLAWENKTCCNNALQAFLSTDIARKIVPLIAESPAVFFGEEVQLTETS